MIYEAIYNDEQKTLCKILTVADAMPSPMTGPRVDRNLPRHGSVRLSPSRGGNRIWSQSFGVSNPAHG